MARPTDLKTVISSSFSLPSSLPATILPNSPYKSFALKTPSSIGLIRSHVSSNAVSLDSTTTLSACCMATDGNSCISGLNEPTALICTPAVKSL